MRYAKLRKTTMSAIAALSLIFVLAAFFQVSQKSVNRASAKQDPQQDPRQGTKRQWVWLSQPPQFLKLIETKNLDSDNWMTDLELKLKNTSDKPIYYIDFIVWAPDLKTGPDVMFSVNFEFGNRDLWDKESLSADDIFLKPGEEIVLSVNDSRKSLVRKRFSYAVPQKGSLQESSSKLAFYFYRTVFGDGTKYIGNQLATPKNSEQSFNAPTQPKSTLTTLDALLPFSGFQFLDVKKKTSRTT